MVVQTILNRLLVFVIFSKIPQYFGIRTFIAFLYRKLNSVADPDPLSTKRLL